MLKISLMLTMLFFTPSTFSFQSNPPPKPIPNTKREQPLMCSYRLQILERKKQRSKKRRGW